MLRKNFFIYVGLALLGVVIGALFQIRPAQTFVERIVDSRMKTLNPREFVYASNRINSSVVAVVVTKMKMVQEQNPYARYFNSILGMKGIPSTQYKKVHNMGSGIVLDSLGYILTSNHVVQGAEELSVAFPDGRSLAAVVIGQDSLSDLAVIQVEPSEVQPVAATFVEKDSLAVGEFVLAVGNPFLNFFNSADPTVTLGIVSALHRNFKFSKGRIYQDMIQTDAAINQGNSGGPLVNSVGEVAGVNSFIYTGEDGVAGSVGIGFAIPGSRAYHIAQELIAHGRRRIAWTGLSVGDEEGVVITSVAQGGPGELAGIQVGDKIVKIAERRIRIPSDIIGVFLPYFPGDTLEVRYERDGKESSVSLILVEVPSKE